MKHILSILVLIMAWGYAQAIVPQTKPQASASKVTTTAQSNDVAILQDALNAAYDFEIQAINQGLTEIQNISQLEGVKKQQIDRAKKDMIQEITNQKNNLIHMKNGLTEIFNQAAKAQTKQAAQDLIKKFISSDKIKKYDYQELMKNGLALVQSKGLAGTNIAVLEREYFDIAVQPNAGGYTL